MKKALVRAGMLCAGVVTTVMDTPTSLAVNDALDAFVISNIACYAIEYRCLMTTKSLIKEIVKSFFI